MKRIFFTNLYVKVYFVHSSLERLKLYKRVFVSLNVLSVTTMCGCSPGCSYLRHLPGQPAPGACSGLQDLQAQVRSVCVCFVCCVFDADGEERRVMVAAANQPMIQPFVCSKMYRARSID